MTGQQLKNSILQMAVQGKLVPQDPNDEPASVLIERIREEKEQLIKDGKIKKEKNPSRIFRGADNLPYEQIGKNQPVCIADEVPFDIPDSWEWVRLDDIGIYRKGPFGSALTKGMFVNKGPDTIKVYEQKNAIKKNHLLGDYYITRKYFEEKMQSFSVKPGDIIVSCAGTIGETYVLPNNIEAGIINQALMRMEIFAPINIDYFLLYFDYVLKDFARMNSKGSAIKNIPPFAIFKKLLLPLPPLAEQIRICKKLKEVITYIETYSVKEQNLSVLNNTFPEQLKKSILQEAVMGKLVPQDENDEPASVLLERIREEKQRLIAEGKIKKDKNESTIFRRDNSHYEKLNGIERCIDDEIPFDIPDNWCWTRLGEVFQHNTGKALNSSNKDGIPLTYITTSNLYWNRFELDELKEMLFTDNEIEKCTVQKGDLLVCEGGDIGRTAIWNYDYPIRIQNHIHRLRSYATVSIEYFYHLLFVYKNLGLIAGKGIGIKGLSSKSLHNILVPLPPLNEQYRIVEQLNTVLPQCEKL